MEIWCASLAGQEFPYDFVEVKVYNLYRGVLPWLGYGFGEAAAAARAIDFVDLVDELMGNEYQWYSSGAPWPLREVLSVFADLVTTWHIESQRDLMVAWDLPTQDFLTWEFGEAVRALEAHEHCCAQIRVNVHWW
jgi:hypothetical protein